MKSPLLRRLGATVTGIATAGLLLTTIPLDGQAAGAAQAADIAAVETDHPVVLVLNTPTGYAGSLTREQMEERARTQFDGLRQYWLDQSAGLVDLSLESLQWDPQPVACGTSDVAREGWKTANNYMAAPRKHLFYSIIDGCPFNAYASANGPGIDGGGQINVEQNRAENGVWAHEFGHSLSFGHANVLYCTDNQIDCEIGSGQTYVGLYGDLPDTMATSYPSIYRGFSTPNAIRVGFIDPSGYADIAEDSTETITIRSRDVLTAGPDDPALRAVRITDPISGRPYYFEMASRDTYNEPIWWGGRANGADIRTLNQPGLEGARYEFDFGLRVLRLESTSTYLLPSPVDDRGVRKDVWEPGSTFVSPTGGVRVEVVSETRTTTTLAIRTRADVVAPDAPTSLNSDGSTVTGTAEPGSTVTVNGPDGAPLGTVVADPVSGAFSFPLTPAQADGVELVLTASDAAGNTSPSATVTVVVPPPAAPAAPTQLSSDGSTISGTADANTTVTVTTDDGTVIASTVASATGTFTSALSPAQEDGVTLNVVSTNATGQTSGVATVIVNTPAVDVPTPPNGLASDGRIVTGTARPGDTVIVRDADGNDLGSVVADTAGAFQVDLATPQPTGTVLTVIARDAQGNTSPAATVTVTATPANAPAAPTELASDGTTLVGVADPGATVEVRTADGVLVGSAVAASDGRFALTLSPAQQQGAALSVTAILGGVSSAPATVFVTPTVLEPPTEPAVPPVTPPTETAAPAPVPSASQPPQVGSDGTDTASTRDGDLAFTGSDLGSLSLLFGIPILAGSGILTVLWLRRRREAIDMPE